MISDNNIRNNNSCPITLRMHCGRIGTTEGPFLFYPMCIQCNGHSSYHDDVYRKAIIQQYICKRLNKMLKESGTFSDPCRRLSFIYPWCSIIVLSCFFKMCFLLWCSINLSHESMESTQSIKDCYPFILHISIILVNFCRQDSDKKIRVFQE